MEPVKILVIIDVCDLFRFDVHLSFFSPTLFHLVFLLFLCLLCNTLTFHLGKMLIPATPISPPRIANTCCGGIHDSLSSCGYGGVPCTSRGSNQGPFVIWANLPPIHYQLSYTPLTIP